MNIHDMIIEVQQQLQKQGAAKTRKFFDDEIEWALNKGQLKWRDSMIRKKPEDNGAYEIDQIHADALRNWTIENASLVTTIGTGSSTGQLPTDYAYLLEDMSGISDTCDVASQTTPYRVPNRLVKHSLLRAMQHLPYYKTNSQFPLSSLSAGKITVYNDGNFTVKGIYIDYLRKPAKMSLSLYQTDPNTGNCEAPEEFHQAICDLTVELLLVDIQAQNAQLKIQQNQIT